MSREEQFIDKVLELNPPFIAFYAGGHDMLMAGFSAGVTDSEKHDIELLAYHFFELCRKRGTDPTELAKKLLTRYNEKHSEWEDMATEFKEEKLDP